MKDIAIYGAGGFGREVACLIQRINEELAEESVKKHHLMPSEPWNLIGFFDDNPELKGKQVSHFGSCFGGIDELNKYSKSLAVILAVGNPHVVRNIVKKISNPKIEYPNLIDTSFYVVDAETFQIGHGNIIQGPSSVSCDVTIGNFNVLNGSVVLGHDVKIGSFNSIMPDTRISGEVTIGEGNFFGVGSIVLQQMKIGNNVKLAAGSVMMTKPRDGNLYMGVPARKMDL